MATGFWFVWLFGLVVGLGLMGFIWYGVNFVRRYPK